MLRMTIAAGLALAVAGCGATPKDGEIMADDVRMQPVALSADHGSAQCAARPMLMHRSRSSSDWGATVGTPGTLYVPKNARVIELACVSAAGGPSTVRYLTSEETAEAKQGQAATGAMFLLLGGLPALATGVAQRSDVYAFPATVSVTLPPPGTADGAVRSAFVERRTAEIERETGAWRELRWAMCKAERSPGERVLDARCEQGLDEIKDRKAQLIAELTAMQTARN